MTLTTPSAPPSPPKARVPVALFAVAIVVAAAVSVGGTAAYLETRPGPAGTTVVDDLAHPVSVPLNPHRVVVLAPNLVDLLYRLGLRGSIVGVGCDASLPGGIYNEYTPNQTALWDLSNASCVTDFPNLNTEGVALLEPEVVFASTLTPDLARQQLESVYGIPVVVLAPPTLDGIVGDVRLVAQIFPEAQAAATSLVELLNGVLANASAYDANFSENNVSIPSVLLTYYFDGGGYYTYGVGTFGDSLISLAGGRNLASSSALIYGELNATVALVDQPDVILYGTSNDSYVVAGQTPSVWPTAPYWSQLNGTKIALDVTVVTEAGPSMILDLPYLLHLLHPTLVPAP